MEIRLDLLLVQRNIVSSREKAKDIIKGGQVFINGKSCLKPSQVFSDDAEIEIRGETLKYVGRGGLKLEKAIEVFSLDLKDKVCADIGASTGGFTDCMLQNGARLVYSVDVGHDQLADKLKNDSRVVNLEGINVRYMTHEEIPQQLDFISIDASFISLKLVIPRLSEFLMDSGEMIALIKPQFEAGKSKVGKNGVVKSEKAHISVITELIAFFESIRYSVLGLTFSPIKGPEGNIEYLVRLKKGFDKGFSSSFDIKKFVNSSFDFLNK